MRGGALTPTGNLMGASGAKAVAPELRAISSMTVLNFSGKRPAAPLLTCAGNLIEDEGARAIAESINASSMMATLILSRVRASSRSDSEGNGIRDRGATDVAAAMKSSVSALDLSGGDDRKLA
jgi:hypothetical protein